MAYLLTRNQAREFCARVQLPDKQSTIGRSARATIRIRDRSVSKLHVSLEPVAGTNRFLLRDLGSMNGIFYRGGRHKVIEIGPGDEFQLGLVSITLCEDSADHAAPATPATPAARAAPGVLAAASTPASRAAPATTLLASTQGASVSRPRWRMRLTASGERARFLAPTERILLSVFLLLVGVFIAAYAILPGREAAAPSTDGAALDARGANGDASNAGGRPADADSAAARDLAKPSPDGDARVITQIPRPLPSEESVRHLPKSNRALPREPWSTLGQELDAACSTSGCHTCSPAAAFHVSPVRELGRWERNLLLLRARDAIESNTDGLRLAAFSTVPPHNQPFALKASPQALRGWESVRDGAGRILGVDESRVRYEAAAAIPIARVKELRRAWLLLYGRIPSPEELAAAGAKQPPELLAEARLTGEFWRNRARATLRGKDRFPMHGGFKLPELVQRYANPGQAEELRVSIRAELERADAAPATTPGGAAWNSAGGERRDAYAWPCPPAPAESGDDEEYARWFSEAVAQSLPPMPRDVFLRSVWTALWGNAPSIEIEDLLFEIAAEPVSWSEIHARAVALLVFAPRMPLDLPSAKGLETWTRGVVNTIAAQEIGVREAREIADGLSQGMLEPAFFLEECVSLMEFVQEDGATTHAAGDADADPPPVRFEILVRASPRELLRRPEELQRLWKRFPQAIVQTFPADDVPLEKICAHSMQESLAAGDEVLVSHLELLDRQPDRARGCVADGYLLPALGKLADVLGEPRPPTPAPGARDWLKLRLGVAERARPQASSFSALLRAGCYKLSADAWERNVYTPATRAVQLADESLKVSPRLPHVICVALADPASEKGKREWEEFLATVDLLATERAGLTFDLWLWGTNRETKGTETVHILWGPSVTRGFVYHEAQAARNFHPSLKNFLPGAK